MRQIPREIFRINTRKQCGKFMSLRSEVVFSDIPINLDVHPVSGDLLRIMNNAAVSRSVRNLVLTKFYERFFRPRLGSNVTGLLFENFDPITEQEIRDGVEEVIVNNEPRAELLDVRVSSEPKRNRFSVSIIFRPVNRTEPVETTVFLERVR